MRYASSAARCWENYVADRYVSDFCPNSSIPTPLCSKRPRIEAVKMLQYEVFTFLSGIPPGSTSGPSATARDIRKKEKRLALADNINTDDSNSQTSGSVLLIWIRCTFSASWRKSRRKRGGRSVIIIPKRRKLKSVMVRRQI